MKNYILLLVFCFMTIAVLQAQDKYTINEILAMDVDEITNRYNDESQKMLYQLTTLGLDSFELEQSLFMVIYFDFALNEDEYGEPYSIGRAVDTLMIVRQKPEFLAIKKYATAYDLQLRKFANPTNWENDVKPALLELAKSQPIFDEDLDEFNEFEAYLNERFKEEGGKLGRSYSDVFKEFKVYQKKKYSINNLIPPPLNTQPIEPKHQMLLPSMRFEEAMANYTDTTKPILIYFTGHGCVNARKVEESGAFTKPKIIKYIQDNYYFISLYVDDRKKLSEAEKEELSEYYGESIKTVGNANSALEMELANSNSQPVIVIIDNKNTVIGQPIGYQNMDFEDWFYDYLKDSLKAYKNRHQK